MSLMSGAFTRKSRSPDPTTGLELDALLDPHALSAHAGASCRGDQLECIVI